MTEHTDPVPDWLDGERSAFEAWVRKGAMFHLEWDSLKRDYQHQATRWLWSAWLARAAIDLVAQLQDEEDEDEDPPELDLEGNVLPGERDQKEGL